MLDTVILTIPKGQYRILKPNMFAPNADILNSSGNFLVKCMNNPTASDKKKGKYRPRMTLMKRMTENGIQIPLKIEFSVAKMVFGNNVDEVQESDFDAVVECLTHALFEMGVHVLKKNIEAGSVSAFHPSKNIPLTNGYTSAFVIKELNKVDVSKKLDLNRDSFRNDGQSLQFYANSHSLVIYDKVQDLKKPEKRAMDKDQNKVQRSLFDVLAKSEHKELLRIEVRLAKKVKLNAVLKQLGLKENPTFRDVFNEALCQKVLLSYWQELIAGKNMFLFDIASSPKKTLERIFKNRPNIKPREAVYLVGLRALSKEGIRETRAIVEKYAATRTWYRIAKDLQFIDDISNKNYDGWVKQVANSLNGFKPFRIRAGPIETPSSWRHPP